MPIRPIIYLADARLRAATQCVENVNTPEIQTLIDDMIETMYAARGVGLAAPQIGIPLRLAVIDVSRENNSPLVLVNPEISAREGSVLLEEGCLSVPGPYDKVPRALKVTLNALNREGEAYTIEADDLLAHVIQHEVDHLEQKLFIDYLSPLKQRRARKKLQIYLRRDDKKM